MRATSPRWFPSPASPGPSSLRRPWRADRLLGGRQSVARRDSQPPSRAPTRWRRPDPSVARLSPPGRCRGHGPPGGPLARPGSRRGTGGPGPGPQPRSGCGLRAGPPRGRSSRGRTRRPWRRCLCRRGALGPAPGGAGDEGLRLRRCPRGRALGDRAPSRRQHRNRRPSGQTLPTPPRPPCARWNCLGRAGPTGRESGVLPGPGRARGRCRSPLRLGARRTRIRSARWPADRVSRSLASWADAGRWFVQVDRVGPGGQR